jgi:Spy/CpxP family protein refolding chaperone
MSRVKGSRHVLALMVVLMSVASTDAAAQRQRGAGGAGQERVDLERRVRARFAEMMRQRLGLDQAQAGRLSETMESFMEARQRIFRDDQALRRRMEAILVEPDPSEADATALLDQMRVLREEEARLFQTEQEALLEILTPVQVVRFHAMREQLGQRIQELRGGQGPPGGRRPGGLGPVGSPRGR